jgi:hypothetical protein
LHSLSLSLLLCSLGVFIYEAAATRVAALLCACGKQPLIKYNINIYKMRPPPSLPPRKWKIIFMLFWSLDCHSYAYTDCSCLIRKAPIKPCECTHCGGIRLKAIRSGLEQCALCSSVFKKHMESNYIQNILFVHNSKTYNMRLVAYALRFY